MSPNDPAAVHRVLEPRRVGETEAAQICRELRQLEAALRMAEAARRRQAVSMLRFVRWPWRIVIGMLCAPWRLVHALRMPPDQC